MLKFGVLAWRMVGGVSAGFFIGLFGSIFFFWVSDTDASVSFLNVGAFIGAGVGGVIAWQSWDTDHNQGSRHREQAP